MHNSNILKQERPIAAWTAIDAAIRLVTRIAAQWRRRRQARLAHFALAKLDAHALRDLGFDRSELLSVVAELSGGAEVTRARFTRRR